jgi:hypothetical protein
MFVTFTVSLGAGGSSVSIVFDYSLDSIPGRGKGFFPLASVSRPDLRPTHHPMQWVPASFFLGNRGGGAADHSPPSNAEFKNE